MINDIINFQRSAGAKVNAMSVKIFLKLKIDESVINKGITTKLISIHFKVISTIVSSSHQGSYKNYIEFITFFYCRFRLCYSHKSCTNYVKNLI